MGNPDRAIAAPTELDADRRDRPFALPVERRYPLDLRVHQPELRDLYHESNRSIWDVERDVAWGELDVSAHRDDVRQAAALVWSWRAWTAFADISLTQAALVRSCIEHDRSADLKFVIACRATERAVAAEACQAYADAIDSYVMGPPTDALAAVLSTGPIRRALHADVSFDAFYVTHFVVVTAVDAALTEVTVAATSDPAARTLLVHTLADFHRQARAGWAHANWRAAQLDVSAKQRVVDNLAAALQADLLRGSRWSALLDPATAGAEAIRAAHDLTAAAGLGALDWARTRQVVSSAIADQVVKLAGLGFDTAPVGEVLRDKDLTPTSEAT